MGRRSGADKHQEDAPQAAVSSMPVHLLRRRHQIAVASFIAVANPMI